MEKKCESCVFRKPNTNDFLPNDWLCGNVKSKWHGYWPPTGLCELYKEPSGRTIREVMPEDMMQLYQVFADGMNAVWRNDSGTKGLENFLNSDSAVIENGKD